MIFGQKQADKGIYAIIIVVAVGFSAFINTLQSQEFECYKIYTSDDGLSQNIVNCMIQDSEGFLWIGTQDGLNCFDGNNFISYQNQPNDSASLSNNYITSLCEDAGGYIWVGTMGGGLNRMDKLTRKFRCYQNKAGDSASLSDNTVWALALDPMNSLWAGTYKGLNVLRRQSDRFIHYTHSASDTTTLPDEMVLSLNASPSGQLWVGTGKGLAEFDFNKNNFRKIIPDAGRNKDLIIWSLANGNGTSILTGTNDGVWEYDTQSGKYSKITGCKNNDSITVWSVLAQGENGYWYGTTQGIHFCDKSKGKPGALKFSLPQDEIPGEVNTWCFLRDHSGTIWAGTGAGIFGIRSAENLFHSVDFSDGTGEKMEEMAVNTILKDNRNNVWVGTEGFGLFRFENNSGKPIQYLADENSQSSLSGNYVWSLYEDKEGIIWIGTYGAGLNSFDSKTELFISYKRNEKDSCAISNNRIFAILEDRDDHIWIGTRGSGLNRFDKRTGCFEEFSNDPSDSTSLSSNIVLSLALDKNGIVWAGTFDGGLCRFNPEDNSFRTFRKTGKGDVGMPDNCIWSILFGSENRLWLGTQSGLYVSDYHPEQLDFRCFTTRDGLPGNVIIGLAEDPQGNLWMSTFKGLAKLNIGEFEKSFTQKGSNRKADPFHPLFTIFDTRDGLRGNEFSQGAFFRADDGTLYFGGPRGLNYFHPDSLQPSRFDPPVKITGFKIFNHEIRIDQEQNPSKEGRILKKNGEYSLPSMITYLDKIILTWRESVISFEFASLDYSNTSKNQYAYRMEGFEKDWNFVGNQTSATYTNLDPGTYIFRVKGTNSGGKWSANEAALQITILPPFWKTLWFTVSVIFAFVIAMTLSVLRIIRNQKRKAYAEKEKMELQLKTIKNQIDPHFAFNAINMIGSMVYKSDPDTVYDYFSRFARLIRTTLQDSEKISRPLGEELEFVKNYIEIQKTRFAGKFTFDLEINPEVDLNTEVPKMIIQTYTENAIKHGLMHRPEGGRLSIGIREKEKCLTISVEDNGIGREKAAALSKDSTKKGMQIIQQIFSLYNKLFNYKISQEIIDLKDSDGNAFGTKVVLRIDKNG